MSSISDAKQSGKLRKQISTWFRLTPIRRFQALLISLALVIGGQLIMHRTIPIESWHDFLESLNEWLRIDAKFLGNVIIGMGCTIVGGVVFALATFNSDLFKVSSDQVFPKPPEQSVSKIYLSKWLVRFLLGGAFFAVLVNRAFVTELEFFDLFFWIAAIFFITSAVFRYDRASAVDLSPRLPKNELIIILLLLIAGLLIGSYQLQDIPNSIQGDEGNFFETARFIANGEYRNSIFGFGVYSYPVFSSFIQGAIMRLFGRDIWGWRFSSLLPALLSVLPLYLLGRDFFNRRVGVISSLIYISSPYYLSFARLGYNNSQAILFVALAIWLFYQGLKRSSLFYIYLGGMATGLGFLTYTAGRLGLVILLVLFLMIFLTSLRDKKTRRFMLVAGLVFAIGGALIAGPHLIYGFQQNPQALRYKLIEGVYFNLDYAVHLFGEDSVYQTSTITYLDNYRMIQNPGLNQRLLLRGVIRSFLGLQLDEFSNNFFLTTPLAGPISAVFYILGLYALIAHFWKTNAYPFLVWFGSGMLFLSIISTFPPRPAHLVPIIPVLALFAGLGVVLTFEKIGDFLASKKPSWGILQTALLLAVCLTIMISGMREYFVESPTVYRPNLEQVMNWAGLHNPPETKIYYVYDSDYYVDWVPYYYRLGLTKPVFESVRADRVLDGSIKWPRERNFAVFYEETAPVLLSQALKDQLNLGSFITFRDQDERAIGRAVVNGKVTLFTAVSLWTGIGRLLTSRVMWLVLPLILLELYLLYKINPQWWKFQEQRAWLAESISGLRIQPSRLAVKAAAEKPARAAPGEPGRFIEFGIFLRLSLRKIDRYFQAKIVLGSGRDSHLEEDDSGTSGS